jgi:predicted nucleotidyltransferase
MPVAVPALFEQEEISRIGSAIDERISTAARAAASLAGLFSSMLDVLMTGQVRVPPGLIDGQALARLERKPAPGVIDEIVRRLVEAVAPEKIILFGSAARGEMRPDSDLDLLVVKSCNDRREVARAVRACLRGVAPGRGKDVVVVTPEDVERDGDTIGYIIRPALREGRVLYAV